MSNKIATGIWLLFLGSVFLLHNLHIIDFNFVGALKLWPLILVSIGIGFLFQNRSYGPWIIAGSNIILCSIIFYQGNTSDDTFFSGATIMDDSEDSTFIPANTVGLLHELDGDRVKLKFNGGAAKFIMNSKLNPDSLFRASTNSPSSSLTLKSEGEGNTDLTLNTKVKSSKSGNNSIYVDLNADPIWDLEYNVGAASIRGDFKNLKLGSLTVNSGASSMEVYLPTPMAGNTPIEISTAASNIKLYIPKGSACRVETDAILSNNRFDDIPETSGDYRQTNGFAQASNRYDIKVEGAANSLSILRY